MATVEFNDDGSEKGRTVSFDGSGAEIQPAPPPLPAPAPVPPPAPVAPNPQPSSTVKPGGGDGDGSAVSSHYGFVGPPAPVGDSTTGDVRKALDSRPKLAPTVGEQKARDAGADVGPPVPPPTVNAPSNKGSDAVTAIRPSAAPVYDRGVLGRANDRTDAALARSNPGAALHNANQRTSGFLTAHDAGSLLHAANNRTSAAFTLASDQVAQGNSLLGAGASGRRALRQVQGVSADLRQVENRLPGLVGDALSSSNTVRVSRMGNKVMLKAKGGGDGRILKPKYPWDGGLLDETHFGFRRPGAIYPAGMPTNMFVAGELWSTSIGGSPYYIKLRCFSNGYTLTSCELEGGGTPSDPIGVDAEGAPVEFSIDLYVITRSKALRVIDNANLLATTYVSLTTEKADLTCGGDPLVRHYTWSINGTL